jgi:aminomethyltransferase|tara:strand:+ start:186 stop:1343 length:1158 start_codon:yes stop_codon:yes gene_type:complete
MKNTSKENIKNYGFGTQIRRSPFFHSTLNWGARDFSVYNHMYIPRDFGNPEQNFWNLVNDAILCDVSVERQVEIKGPDATKFVQYLTPRDISKCDVGQCKYILLTDNNGGILNDPVLLRIEENHYWLSLADSDILLWAKGVLINSGMDVQLCEPDVSPLQLQGPKSREIMKKIFGEQIDEIGYYRFKKFKKFGIPLIISRTGWSSELGYEIFLCDGSKGSMLWEEIMKIGAPLGLKPGHTSTIRRVEGAMLSYHADINSNNNPYEVGLERLVDLDKDDDFIGKLALTNIKKNGAKNKQIGLVIECDPLQNPNNEFWDIINNNKKIGKVTSAVYSPRLEKNIALAIIESKYAKIGSRFKIGINDAFINCEQVSLPFYDPKKSLAKQ